MQAGGKHAHGDATRDAVAAGDEVAERLMSVVRWRSTQQQQQQQQREQETHQQADEEATAVATDRAALLRALCEAAGRVVFGKGIQSQRIHGIAWD